MTTDITELAQSLKAAAENATPGEWCSDDQYGIAADSGLNGNYYIASCSGPEHRQNKRFIALANPANVIALVEALEKAQATEAHCNRGWREAHEQEARAEAAEKRIAELESLTVNPEDTDGVREEDNKFLVVRHPGKVPVIKHPVGQLDDYLLHILKADPLATIDIVTHRYYGVGGQFVEDADEYLHEMGIKWEVE